MRVFVDALHGNRDDARAVAAAGGRLSWRGPSPGVPVLRHVAGADLEHVTAGDVVVTNTTTTLTAFAAACRTLGAEPWVVARSPSDVRAAIAANVGCWLRGLEAGGPVGEHSGLVLLRAAHGHRHALEGAGRRARAASVAVGAEAVILTVQTWLCTGTPLCDAHRSALLGATTGRDTMLVGELDSRRARWLARGQSVATAKHARSLDPAWIGEPAAPIPAPQCVFEVTLGADTTLADLVRRVQDDLVHDGQTISTHHPLRPSCDPFSTGTPIVQGPMANVSEREGLARSVAKAGGLPFAALGALRPADAKEVLTRFATLDGPWGVGLIGFDVMPHRDAHLELIAEAKPAAVILAGGSPALALRLQSSGLSPWLHTPSARLAEHALAAGVAAVVFEGSEAGGHVGQLTSLGLWEEGLAVVESASEAALVVLAGGIGDACSSAFAAAMAAGASKRGAEVGLQVGTAFFFTRDIVEAEQLTATCQRVALEATRTELVGQSVNLPLRCAPGPFTAAARELEQRWARDGLPRAERRERMEHHNLGRTRVAAKGITRSTDQPGCYRTVSSQELEATGAFTMGGGAAVTQQLTTVAELVHTLTAEAAALLAPQRTAQPFGKVTSVAGAPSTASAPRTGPVSLGGSHDSEPIAIVGMGCLLPGADSLEAFWTLLLDGVDAVTDVPPERWRTDRYYDPVEGGAGTTKSTSQLAGLVRGFTFDPLAFRIPPAVAATLDPAQQLALTAAAEAVRRAGLHDGVDKKRAAVVLGNAMGGEYAKSLALRVRFREVLDVLDGMGALSHLSDAARATLDADVEERLADRLPPVQAETMSGLLANVIAGRVAAWLDWMGGNLTVDAACAASLAAITVAVDWLRMGRCDVVLTGGVDTDLSAESYVGFSRTHALSSARSRPFHTDADGFVMGEGAAVLALKRLSDAQRDGDAIWGLIRGVGQASDGRARGITAPRAEGQRLAIDRAWSDAGLDPRQAALAEAHGTGTSLGDRTEVGVLARVFGEGPTTWLGSVKSNIGHLKGGAAAASVVKTTLALATGVVPPTLNAGPVSPSLGLEGTSLQLPRWPARLTERRTAGVSAFGFGGTDFHVVLDTAPPGSRRPPELEALTREAEAKVVEDAAWPMDPPEQAWCWGASSLSALIERVKGPLMAPQDAAREPHRVVALGTDLASTQERAARWLASDAVTKGARSLGDTLFRGEGPPEPVIVLAPGQGAQRRGAVASLRASEPGRRALEQLEAHLPFRLDHYEHQAASTAALHPLIYGLSVGWGAVLRSANIPIAGAVGHSLGELGALAVAGRLDPVDGLQLVQARGAALEACPAGQMLAVAAAPELVAPHLGDDAVLATLNSPQSTVIAGDDLAEVTARLHAAGLRTTQVAVTRAFHSPSVGPAATALADALSTVSFREGQPVWSARSTDLFPADPGPDLVAALTEPVRFAEAIAQITRAGHQLFVELGPGRILSSSVRQLAPHARAIPLDPRPDPVGLGRLRAAAALCAEGYPELLAPRAPSRPQPQRSPSTPVAARPTVQPSELAPRARAVQDLRIAALADPSLQPTYEAARSALLSELAAHDAGQVTPTAAPVAQPAVPAPAAPVQARPSAPTPPPQAPAPTVAAESTRDVVVAAICELTGYPPDFLEDDAQLEADLGVDSIKKMEVLGLLQDRLDFVADEADYATLADVDLAGLVQYADERRSGGTGPTEAEAPAPPRAAAALHRPVWRWSRPAPTPESPVPIGFSRSEHRLVWRGGSESTARVLSAWLATAKGSRPPEQGLVVFVRPDSVEDAAALGFARSWAREAGVPLRSVVTGAPHTALISGDPGHHRLHHQALLTHTATPQSAAPSALPSDAFWVVTGGVSGIVVPCVATLEGARVLLLGRTPADSPEVHRALDTLEQAGVTARYCSCDATDADGVTRAIAAARADWGPVSAVLHGAGVLRDGLVERLGVDDIETVLAPKLTAAQVLAAATEPDAPQLWCVFSSVVAQHGNAGQTLYAAANCALETVVHPSAHRHLALRWTAWQRIGMAADPRLQAVLARRGVSSLTPEQGAAAFRRALGASGVVSLTGTDPSVPLPWPLAAVTSLRLEHSAELAVHLDPSEPSLADHQVGGRPLVPGAVWIRAMRDALALTTGSRGPWSLADVSISAPTFVSQPRSDVRVRVERGASGWVVEVLVGSASVASAVGLLANTAPPSASPPEMQSSGPAAPLYRDDLLFHGPVWQVLDEVSHDGNGQVAAALVLRGGTERLDGVLDGVHQLLSAWAGTRTGFLALPVGAERWWIPAETTSGTLHLHAHVETSPDGVVGEVTVTDDAGDVVLRGERVRLRSAGRWPQDGPETLGGPLG